MIVMIGIIHGAICVLGTLLIVTKKIKVSFVFLPILYFLPIVGAFVLVNFLWTKGKKEVNDQDFEWYQVKEEAWKRIKVYENKNQEITVPLEEAMLINDSKVSRELMIDILNRNPMEYIDIFKKAMSSNDNELAQYATTAMMEVQREYEIKIQEFEEKLRTQPTNTILIRKFTRLMIDYINSGLLSGNVLVIQRRKLKKLLKDWNMVDSRNRDIFTNEIDNDLELQEYEEAFQKLLLAQELWEEDEKLFLLFLKYFCLTNNGDGIKELLEKHSSKSYYLSSKGREFVAFWTTKEA